MELQHFDLAGPVIPDVTYLENVTPILMLWNTHDLVQVKTQGLVFETQIGRGRLLVSALRHTGVSQAAGPWLARVFANHLATGPAPRHAVGTKTIAELKDKVQTQHIDLTMQEVDHESSDRRQVVAEEDGAALQELGATLEVKADLTADDLPGAIGDAQVLVVRRRK